jgi:hypothetical protein
VGACGTGELLRLLGLLDARLRGDERVTVSIPVTAGLARPSTPPILKTKFVDTRHKAGHDAAGFGAEVKTVSNKAYTEGEIGEFTIVEDFLPPPEELVLRPSRDS